MVPIVSFLNFPEIVDISEKCENAAKAAAPFVHPRLQAVEHSGQDGDAIPHSIAKEFV